MKILCVIDSLCFGGSQRQMVELALAFNEKGHSVSFLTYHHIPFFNPVVENVGIPVTCIEEPNYFKRLLKMRQFIRKGRYEAILSFLEASNFIAEIAGLPFRHWKLVVGERSANPEILHSFRLKFYRWFHFLADSVVANSETNMSFVNRINRFIPSAKCKIIYNTLDFDDFKPSTNFSYRQKNRLKLVVAARVQVEKNITGLLEALSLLWPEERDSIKVEWYGELKKQPGSNEFLEHCKAEIKKRGLSDVISLHPATHNIRRVIQESDAVGLFSFYEGFPNVVCEAMACAKPIVCTQVSDISLFLSHEPRLLCKPTDANSIRDSLAYLIQLSNSELKQIGEKNRTIALSNFDKETIVSAYLKLLGNGVEKKLRPTKF